MQSSTKGQKLSPLYSIKGRGPVSQGLAGGVAQVSVGPAENREGTLEPTNSRRGQRLCEGVGGLISGGDVDEAESASVHHLVTEAVVAGVDVGAFAGVGEGVGAELDAGLVVLQEWSRLRLGQADVGEEGAELQRGAGGVVSGVVLRLAGGVGDAGLTAAGPALGRRGMACLRNWGAR